jgi:hypothetical protein
MTEIGLEEWSKFGYAKSDFAKAMKEFSLEQETVDRIHSSSLSVVQFKEQYESKSLPVIIEGITDNWPA